VLKHPAAPSEAAGSNDSSKTPNLYDGNNQVKPNSENKSNGSSETTRPTIEPNQSVPGPSDSSVKPIPVIPAAPTNNDAPNAFRS
jgi:hypothetical protein